MDKIFWLASYPKSGNTWVRAFLTNYLNNREAAADINHLEGGPIASDRELFDRWAGVEASDLPPEEIECLRPEVYRQMARHIRHPLYLKVHDACLRTAEGELLFPPDVTGGVLYLIRNPLDVAVSLSHHLGRGMDHAIRRMVKPESRFIEDSAGLSLQLPQCWLDWSSHVRSWLDESGLPVRVVRYEDMTYNPGRAFPEILAALNLSMDRQRMERAIRFSSFEQLQAQESQNKFKEISLKADSTFFRKGQAGSWREELSREQAQLIMESQGEMMRRFGYLDSEGKPIF